MQIIYPCVHKPLAELTRKTGEVGSARQVQYHVCWPVSEKPTTNIVRTLTGKHFRVPELLQAVKLSSDEVLAEKVAWRTSTVHVCPAKTLIICLFYINEMLIMVR